MNTDNTYADSGFADVVDPQENLVHPSGINGYPRTLLDSIDEVLALTSPSAWILELVYGTIGTDPFQEVAARLAGDWKCFADCVDLWRMLGDAYGAVATNLRRGNSLLDATWDGNAADAAFDYFRELTTYLDSLDRALKAGSEAYERLALLVWYGSKGLGELLQTLIDFALCAATAVAAGAATATTGVGPVVAAAVAAAALTKVGQTWILITKMLTRMEVGIFGICGSVAQLCYAIKHLPRPPTNAGLSTAPPTGDW
ncbi:hypothetical protein [Actinopolymorpha rutila]|uniref:PPE family protein n=1 Tax=Actinopolymorpha rutila TaxID=446787 RepID=A0A852ZHS4_9ACTN|nr:hypothetical protein [Actinopolymorpha rutila]NYH91695.1 hypothetical protein [Actinopolymorpha rutila]